MGKFANDSFDMELISRMHKELQKLNTECYSWSNKNKENYSSMGKRKLVDGLIGKIKMLALQV